MTSWRKKAVAAVSVLAIALGFVSAPAAKAAIPGVGYNTSFRVQNTSGSVANCSYDVYSNAGGSALFSQSITAIAVDDSYLVYTGAVAGFPAGTNSGVVNCDQEVSVVVAFANTNMSDAYLGTSLPASTMYLPITYKNFFNFSTSVRIQNTSSTSQNIVLTYYEGSVTPVTTQNFTLAGNGSVTVDQATIAALANNKSYSVKIVGTQPLAVNATIFGITGTAADKQTLSYSGFSGGTNTVYTPIVLKNYYAYNSSTTVQNVGAATANVVQTYSNGTIVNHTIAPNASKVILDYQNVALPSGNTNGSFSAKLTSDQPIIVVVNEGNNLARASAYEGLAAGTTKVVSPSVVKTYFGYNSSIQCQNVGAAAATVNVAYKGKAGAATVNLSGQLASNNLAPNASVLIYLPANANIPVNFAGSAVVTSTQPVVCVVSQDQNTGAAATTAQDTFAVYDGINK
jgi:hypothetical protein